MASDTTKSFTEISDLTGYLEKQKDWPRKILLFSSDNTVLESVFALALKKNEKNGQPEAIRLHGQEAEVGVFHAEFSTIPIFAVERILLVRHADPLLQKIHEDETLLKYFKRDIGNMPEMLSLILQFDDKKIPAGLSGLKDNAVLFEPKELKERDLPGYLAARARQSGFHIEPGAIELLCERTSYDYKMSLAALDRVITYTLSEKNISVQSVKDAVFSHDGDKHFQIIDTLAEADFVKCRKIFLQHRYDDAVALLSQWIKLFTDALRYRSYSESGMNAQNIHQILELNTNSSYIFQKNNERFIKMNRRFSESELIHILELMIKADKRLKENTGPLVQSDILLHLLSEMGLPANHHFVFA